MIADRIVRTASRLVPVERRAEWLERWRSELWVLEHGEPLSVAPWRFALGALPDAWYECAAGWREGASLEGVTGDLRRAWRGVRRARLTSTLTALIVGVGSASLTSVVAVVDATLLRTPPAIARADELFQIGRGPALDLDNFSYANVRDLTDALRPVTSLAAYSDRTVVVGTGTSAELVSAQVVTSAFFEVAGVPVGEGSGLLSDTEPGVVLSRRFWIDHGPEIVTAGRWIAVDGQPTPIAGVAAPGFVGVQTGGVQPAMWLSLGAVFRAEPARRLDRGHSWLWTFGRRQPGASLDAVAAAASAAHANLSARSPFHRATLGASIVVVNGIGLRPGDRAEAIRLSKLLVAGTALVLVIALANVTGLQLANALGAAPAAAMMLAMGATRARLLRGRLFELLILTAAGGVVAWVAAWLMTAVVQATLPYPVAVSLEPQWRAFAICTLASMALVVLVAVVPLSRVTRVGSVAALSSSLRGIGRHSRATTALVILQLGLSSALLASCGLLIRSVWAAAAHNPGFDSGDVLVATLRPSQGRRPAAAITAEIIARARGVAGVEAVGVASRLPFVGGVETRTVARPGSTGADPAGRVALTTFAVDRGFFDVLNVRFLTDKGLPSTDAFATSTAVLTRTAVDRLWPDAMAQPYLDTPRGPVQIAGVTPEMRLRSLRGSATPAMFVPLDTSELPRHLIVRTRRGEDAVANLRTALATLNSDVVVVRLEPYATLIAASLADTRMATRLAMPLAAVAVLLSMAGLYGAMSRRVIERQHEFGVRLALGATAPSIVRVVLREVLIVAALACASGGALYAIASIALRQLLFGVAPFDSITLAAAFATTLLIAVAAATLPARRAGSLDPLAVLRDAG